VIVELLPDITEVGFAEQLTVGGSNAFTAKSDEQLAVVFFFVPSFPFFPSLASTFTV
jgi:hypothetical protein